MKRSILAGLCALILMASCHHRVIKTVPPGQVKKTTAPGQVKKVTGSKSAAPYAPGQNKNNGSKAGKKN